MLYNHAHGEGEADASEVAGQVERAHVAELEQALGAAGYDVVSANIDDDPDRVGDAVVVHRPSIVFHLFDQVYGDDTQHGALLSMLDLYGYVYTGCDAVTLATCQDRVRSRVLLAEAGVSVPGFVVIRDLNAIPDTDDLRYPLLVTQALDDVYHEGHDSQVDSREELEARVRELAAGFELPFLVEEHLAGRHLHAVLVGNRALEVLPLVEATDSGLTLAQLEADTAGTVRQLARRAFRVLGCRDVAQVDFVLGDDGAPRVIDVRPQIDYFGQAPFRVAAEASEHGLHGALALVLRTAHLRLPPAELAAHPLPVPPDEVDEHEGDDDDGEADDEGAAEGAQAEVANANVAGDGDDVPATGTDEH